jgi:imidazolonepropionase-like amidohydrolase
VRAPLAWLGPGRLVRDAAVVARGAEIVYAGSAWGAPPTDEELEVDGFLMPAYADRHVHIGLSDPVRVVRGGVTAVRDLAWPAEDIFPLAEASELPSFRGPLIRAAGPMLTAPGGYPQGQSWATTGTARVVRGVDDAAAAVGDLAERGATAIKVSLNAEAGATVSDAELGAICVAAGERELPVTVHAQGEGQVERALGAGVVEFAHCPWTHKLSDSVIGQMASATRVVSTLDMLSYGRDTPELRRALDNLRRFVAAGGRVSYGTDLGNGAIPPGIDLREVVLLREAGLEMEAILTALARSPLEPGAPADVVGLRRDPFEEIDALGDLLLVVREGRVIVPE